MSLGISNEFTKNVTLATVFTLGLLLLNPLRGVAERIPLARDLAKVIDKLDNADLNVDDVHALMGNYYEGIEHTVRIAQGSENYDYHLRYDFLRYEFKPNLKRRYPAGMRITNTLGMPNPEYGYAKPPHTRRIALLGDSVSVGPYGQDYVARLEESLNRDHLPRGVQKIQILNFSVPGYILVQKLDVALEKASKFHPDAYILQLGSLEIGGTARHLGRLVASGTDFKYDFLRQVAAQARLRPDDHRPTVNFKLAPFFQPMTRWATEQIRDHAVSEGAPLVIILVPAVMNADITGSDFDQLHKAIDGLGVPIIDLRDTFRSGKFAEFQVVPGRDIHPNARGHEMIFKNLYTKLEAQHKALVALAGAGS